MLNLRVQAVVSADSEIGYMSKDYQQDPLWLKLQRMTLDDPDAPFPFSERLKLETGLSDKELRAAIGGYLDCLYVAVKTGVTPVMPILADAVWRRHITYTRHYWNVLGKQVLGEELHRFPPQALADAAPGIDHKERFEAVYIDVLGSPPPKILEQAIPGPKKRGLLDNPLESAVYAGLVLAFMFAFSRVGPWVIAAPVLVFVLRKSFTWVAATYTARHYSIPRRDWPREPSDRVWKEINTMELEELSGTTIPFSKVLADETGWDAIFVRRAMDEYRRFLYLKHVCHHQVTPSSAVDNVWHLHLQHSHHYWHELCEGILGKPFHHQPAAGIPGEWERFEEQYFQTVARYDFEFGIPPPEDIWPYKPTFRQKRMVDYGAAALLLTLLLVIAAFPAHPPLAVLAGVAAASLAMAASRYVSNNDRLISRLEVLGKSNWEVEWSSGGCGGCGGCGG